MDIDPQIKKFNLKSSTIVRLLRVKFMLKINHSLDSIVNRCQRNFQREQGSKRSVGEGVNDGDSRLPKQQFNPATYGGTTAIYNQPTSAMASFISVSSGIAPAILGAASDGMHPAG